MAQTQVDYTELLATADAHIKNKEYAQAEQIYAYIYKIDAKNIGALDGFSILAFHQGNYEKAILLLQQTINFYPENANLYYNISLCYHAQSNFDQAIVACKRAIELLSGYTEAQHFLAALYSKKSEQLASAERWEEAWAMITNAVVLGEQFLNADIYYQLGFYSEKAGQPLLAKHYWKRLVSIAPNHPHVRVALDNLYKASVPNWHLSMMNDEVRNNAFQTVIERNCAPDKTILDIGTGSGLTSMIAARAGYKTVYTCEEVELLADKASEIIKANGFDAEQIKIIKKCSTNINMPEDFPEKADVIITETFGTSLIEENCLETINHAIKNLLKPGGTIIPQGAALFVSLIESSDLYQIYHVQNACGFNLSAFNEFSDAHVGMWLERLNLYNYKILTNAHVIKKFDFYAESSIFQKECVSLTAQTDGVGHALCLWFDLYLDDTTTITTHPMADASIQAKSWGQRIRTLELPLTVRKGDVINVELTNANNYITAVLI